MKNLSKVLSLILALAMIVGVFTLGASAAFKDEDDITYDEAVTVLAGIKVLEGFEDGSFKPEDDVTREQAAKIITYMLLGKTLADTLVTEKAPFDDVKATRWSAGYIAYCVQEGIIGGYGDGKFGPTDKVTGYQLAKMLLVALGFDAAENGLTGANWTISTAKLAFENKLFTGNLGADYTKGANREEAALYTFNALFYGTKTVTSTATKFVLTATKASLADISGNYYDTFDGAKAAAKAKDATAVYGTDYTVNSMAITSEKVEGSLADTVFALTKDTTVDAFGRPGTSYSLDGEALTFSAAEPVLTYTNAVQGKKIYADLALTTVPTITATEDGAAKLANIAVSAASTDVFGGNGSTVEVYKTATGKYSIVIINTYFDTVKSVKTTTDATTGVKTTTLTLTGGLTSTKLVDFAKKDAVLYTKAGTTIMSMAKAATVSGALTKATNNTQFTIGGAVYTIGAKSALNNAAIVGVANANMGKTVSYYVDGTNLMAAVDTVVAATAGTYIKVLAAATPTTSGDYIAGAGQYTGKVYGILSDGTYGEYTVNYSADEIVGQAAATANAIYAYELNTAGQMVLSTSVTTAATAGAIVAGQTVVNTSKVLNSNTQFIFYTQKSGEATIAALSTKKGNANSGTIAAGATLVYEDSVVIAVYVGGTYVDGTEVVDAAYIDASTKTSTTESEVTEAGTVTKTVYSYTAYTAAGDEITLTSSTVNIDADAVYKYNTDNTIGALASTVSGKIALFGSTIQLGGSYYNYNASMVNFLAEDTALAAGQTVVAIANATTGTLTHIWVTVDAPVED